ncbi:glutamate dehydrogenase/leucine dehydrogenase [Williamsia limnetica]|uniref:Glutamate dehydrogenase/leucine dehydrogenase n=1 Tax=Williamsia limnetica TaxID=882452 RepID=A0A318RMK1_WILLI|nr:Glu/Leu/Phe/Val dehydrogenase dimerization domain-containing protein [Williamsia limnetica]PYE18547.1 glutamate dehydrogenase/leucine dehydrogenase [Williamsia limnetica]
MSVTITPSSVDTATSHVFDRTDFPVEEPAHEQVVFCQDSTTGLRAIIALHSTTLGPALGGTRFRAYSDEGAALTDVLRLSRGMTYKAAAAGLELGGGKAVIIGEPRAVKTPELLRAYGSFVERLGGRYVTAGDVGTNSNDLDIMGETTAHVVGRNTAAGGSGDSGPNTALGVFQAMRAAAVRAWGDRELQGRTVGVEGAGKVGFELIALLTDAGADIVVADPYQPSLDRVLAAFPRVRVAGDVRDERLDVYAPCALGATVNATSVETLDTSIICGAANNQLLTPVIEGALADRGIVWIPDYVANSGGLIQVEGELRGRGPDEVRSRVEKVFDTMAFILDTADRESILPGVAADRIARRRLDDQA